MLSWPEVKVFVTVTGVVPERVIEIELLVEHSPLTLARTNNFLW
jgi:hypothetical protein